MLDVAPLLDADRQNVLPAKASELRRGYSESDEAAALALGPGVNLLSSNYVSNDEIMGSTEERLSLKSVIKEEKSNFPRERYVPSIGHTSQRSGKEVLLYILRFIRTIYSYSILIDIQYF